jgi:hypothetical protein
MPEVNFHGLSNRAADVNRWQEDVDERCRDLVQELTLLQTRGSELCHTIIDPPMVRGHQSEGMQVATNHQAEMSK